MKRVTEREFLGVVGRLTSYHLTYESKGMICYAANFTLWNKAIVTLTETAVKATIYSPDQSGKVINQVGFSLAEFQTPDITDEELHGVNGKQAYRTRLAQEREVFWQKNMNLPTSWTRLAAWETDSDGEKQFYVFVDDDELTVIREALEQ